jgi:hypothetical protein
LVVICCRQGCKFKLKKGCNKKTKGFKPYATIRFKP